MLWSSGKNIFCFDILFSGFSLSDNARSLYMLLNSDSIDLIILFKSKSLFAFGYLIILIMGKLLPFSGWITLISGF